MTNIVLAAQAAQEPSGLGMILGNPLVMILLMFVILLTKRQYKYLIPFIPSLTGWATVMAATPVAFSLRYVYFLFLLQPIFVYLLVLGLRQDQ